MNSRSILVLGSTSVLAGVIGYYRLRAALDEGVDVHRLADRLRSVTAARRAPGYELVALLPQPGYTPSETDVRQMASGLAAQAGRLGDATAGRVLLGVQLHADTSGRVVVSWFGPQGVVRLPGVMYPGLLEPVDPRMLTNPNEQPGAHRDVGELVLVGGTPRQGLGVGQRLIAEVAEVYRQFDQHYHESGFLQIGLTLAGPETWAAQLLIHLTGDNPQQLRRHTMALKTAIEMAWKGRWRLLRGQEAGPDTDARLMGGRWRPSGRLLLSTPQAAGWLLPPAATTRGLYGVQDLHGRLPAAPDVDQGEDEDAPERPAEAAPAEAPGVDPDEQPPAPAPVLARRPARPGVPAGTDRQPPARRTGDVLLGASAPQSAQSGILGMADGRRVRLDLNETHTISLFGVQGGGKSYTLGSIAEMASLPIPGVNTLPHPLATIIFHYSQTQDYEPEFTSMTEANTDAAQLRVLRDRYGARPQTLHDVVLLVPEDQLAERRAEHPGLQVHALKFSSSELRAEHWRFLMGAVGNQSTYIRQLQRVMRANRNRLSLDVIRQGVTSSSLPDHLVALAEQRLDLAEAYIDDQVRIKDLIRPGRLVIVDLRDEFIEKDEALGLFVVLMQLFAEATGPGGERFNKLVVFDEAHKYIESPSLVAGLVESVREMRHKGMSVLVASQDPPSVPISLIELSNHVILHKMTSPEWLKHIKKANVALARLTPAMMAELTPGEAYVWSSRATDPAFTDGAVKVTCRPRVTKHGGATKTAAHPGS